jgi:hypothetical protein
MALTVQQAEREAGWRWGGLFARGFARHRQAQRLAFEVGTKRFGSIKIRGQGTSWEGAFENASTLTNAGPATVRPVKQAASPTGASRR